MPIKKVNAVIKLETIGHPLYAVIQHLIVDTQSEFYDKSKQYRVFIKLYGDEVASGMDFNPNKAAARAIEVAHEYAVKKGLIIPAKKEVNFSFSVALDFLKNGEKITRKGWNGADQWLSISCPDTKDIPAESFWSPHNAEYARKNGGSAKVAPCITLKNAQGMIIMGWIPSAGDLFADDWMISA